MSIPAAQTPRKAIDAFLDIFAEVHIVLVVTSCVAYVLESYDCLIAGASCYEAGLPVHCAEACGCVMTKVIKGVGKRG